MCHKKHLLYHVISHIFIIVVYGSLSDCLWRWLLRRIRVHHNVVRTFITLMMLKVIIAQQCCNKSVFYRFFIGCLICLVIHFRLYTAFQTLFSLMKWQKEQLEVVVVIITRLSYTRTASGCDASD